MSHCSLNEGDGFETGRSGRDEVVALVAHSEGFVSHGPVQKESNI